MSQTTAAPSLRKAIEIYRAQYNEELDEHAEKLLTRLASSRKAAEAFEGLRPKDDYDEAAIVRERQSAGARAFLNRVKKGNPQAVRAIEQQLKPEDRGKAVDGQGAVIRACIEAENLARTFPEREMKAKLMLERVEHLRKAASTLRAWLKEIISEQQKPPDPLWVRKVETHDDIEAMELGLAAFERWIKIEERVADVNLFQLKVTQKSKTSSAGQIAATKLFVEQVMHVIGKFHERGIKNLLEVILGTEVSSGQVRDAQPERLEGGHWQWAARSVPEEMRRLPKEKRKPETGS